MAATITVERKQPVPTGTAKQGYYLVLEATGATDMPSEVFVFQRTTQYGESADDEFADLFVNVASPSDIEETPVGLPNDDNNPYYRSSDLTLCFRSAVELEECWAYIKEDIEGLVEALNSLENLEQVEEVTF